MADASLTWLGHASFRLDSPGGKRIYVDPWLENPKCPESEKEPERCDVIAVTHGHDDHVGSAIELSQKFGPLPIVAMIELKGWLKANGAQADELPGPNKGGTVEAAGVKFTLTNAFHSGSAPDGVLRRRAGRDRRRARERHEGLLRRRHLRLRRHAADREDLCTRRRRSPDRRALHDGSTGGGGRLRACSALSASFPATTERFPLLAGTPDELRQLAKGVEIVAVDPGGSVEL